MKEIFVTSPDTIAQLIIELHLVKGLRREKRSIRSKTDFADYSKELSPGSH
jgi:hypothetical protein